jgi:hypothetical protein
MVFKLYMVFLFAWTFFRRLSSLPNSWSVETERASENFTMISSYRRSLPLS